MEKGNEEEKQSREIKILRSNITEFLRNSRTVSVTVIQRPSERLWEVGQERQAEPASISPLGPKPQD